MERRMNGKDRRTSTLSVNTEMRSLMAGIMLEHLHRLEERQHFYRSELRQQEIDLTRKCLAELEGC